MLRRIDTWSIPSALPSDLARHLGYLIQAGSSRRMVTPSLRHLVHHLTETIFNGIMIFSTSWLKISSLFPSSKSALPLPNHAAYDALN